MSLQVLIDFDNLSRQMRQATAVNTARTLLGVIPTSVTKGYTQAQTRLYGGWRSGGIRTQRAQSIAADIASNAPFVYAHPPTSTTVRVTVELADGLFGAQSSFADTLVKERGLRNFRASSTNHSSCMNGGACGMHFYKGLTESTSCGVNGCPVQLGDVLVRDEQKMVDSTMIADMAKHALHSRAQDIVVVSSDVDVWPGILLSILHGCRVIQIHTTRGWRTQRALVNTIPSHLHNYYIQSSV